MQENILCTFHSFLLKILVVQYSHQILQFGRSSMAEKCIELDSVEIAAAVFGNCDRNIH